MTAAPNDTITEMARVLRVGYVPLNDAYAIWIKLSWHFADFPRLATFVSQNHDRLVAEVKAQERAKVKE